MTTTTVNLSFQRSAKNTHRFEAPERSGIMGAIYVEKSVVEDPDAFEVIVTVRPRAKTRAA